MEPCKDSYKTESAGNFTLEGVEFNSEIITYAFASAFWSHLPKIVLGKERERAVA